ncbi:MAG: transglutaminase TgpA family protein [Methylococcales bacterium]
MLTQKSLVPENSATLFTLLVTLLVALPHVFHVPHSIFAFFISLLGYRLAGIKKPSLPMGKSLLLGLTGVGLGLLTYEHRTIIGLHAGTSFFLVSLGLKMLELKQVRDLYLIIFLCFFVAITQFLYTQSVLMIFYIVLTTGLLVTALVGLSTGSILSLKQRVKLSSVLVLQAIPITIFLFLLFPRIPSPRFGLASPTGTAQTGLSDSMQPGSISQLSQSSEVAFRVNFKGNPPPPRDRYWRGPVFWHTDGSRWTLIDNASNSAPPIQLSGAKISYEVTLEPHGQRWLFALDLPANQPPGSSQTSDFLLLAGKAVTERISYSLISFPQYNTGSLSGTERALGLQLPRPPSRRIAALVSPWQIPGAQARTIVQKALDYFHDEEFFYTLSPPLYPKNPTESFLFESKRGFCEHFASAFVYLMRAAKIPARIVTGYQGGEFNTLGRFLEIRQSDAHAWVEVWLSGRGWVRVDPTAAVAPERIDRGIDALRQQEAGSFGLGTLDLVESVGIFQNIRFAWASLDHAWHQWVLSYNAFNQSELLSRFGLEDLKSMVLSLVAALTLCLVLTALILLKPAVAKIDKGLLLYLRFCGKLAKAGFKRQDNEGAGDFARRVIHRRPELGPEILRITCLYHKVRYGRFYSGEDLNDLTRAVRGLRIRP